jgi:hypothetical protein
MLVAIELGTRRLTAVQARVNGQGAEIVRSASAELAAADPGSLRAAIEKCGVAGERAVLVVQRGQSVLRDLELPEGTPDELVSMVRFQVERELPFPLDQVRYSFVETARGGGKVRVQVAAVPRDVLDPAVAALEGAGVKVAGAYVSSFGLLSLYRNGGPAALVEVAGGEAEILVVDQGRMEFSRSAPLVEGAEPASVAEEVDRTLLAWAARAPGKRVEKVVLAGEGEQAGELARALRARLTHEVAQVGPGDLDTAAAAGVCVGLSRGVAMPDLLHPPVVVRKFRLTHAHRVAGLALVVVALVVAWSQIRLAGRRSLLEEKKEALARLQPRAADVTRMSRQTLQAHEWYRDRNTWVRTLEILRAHIRTSDLWITGASFEETGIVRLQGKTRDDRHATALAAAIKAHRDPKTKAPHFSDATVQKVTPNSDKGEYRKDFTIEAHLVGSEAKRRK